MSETLPLEGKSYQEIQQLAPDTVINPTYPEEYHITLAEALSLSLMMTKQEIPSGVIQYFKDDQRFNAKELAEQAELWNSHFARIGLIDAIQDIAAMQLTASIRKTSSNTYSEVKQIQVIAAAQAINYAYLLS
jgi:hypothetical protein